MRQSCFFLTALLLFALIAAGPVSGALTSDLNYDFTDVSEYGYTANDGYVIYEILVDELPMGANQTHHLYYGTDEFTLTIGSGGTLGWHVFDLSLTYPNGTIETKQVSTWRVSLGHYVTKIQPVFTKLQSGYWAYATVDLEVGLSPISTGFGTQPATWDASTAIPFTYVDGTLGDSTNVYVYSMSENDFEDNVRNYNPLYGFEAFTDAAGEWAYSQVIAFLNSIPVIGPLLITVMGFIGIVVTEVVYWIAWIINNIFIIIVGGEVGIAMAAVIAAGKDSSGVKSARNWFKYNISCIKGFFWAVETIWSWLVSFVQMIASVIQSLRSLLGL